MEVRHSYFHVNVYTNVVCTTQGGPSSLKRRGGLRARSVPTRVGVSNSPL